MQKIAACYNSAQFLSYALMALLMSAADLFLATDTSPLPWFAVLALIGVAVFLWEKADYTKRYLLGRGYRPQHIAEGKAAFLSASRVFSKISFVSLFFIMIPSVVLFNKLLEHLADICPDSFWTNNRMMTGLAPVFLLIGLNSYFINRIHLKQYFKKTRPSEENQPPPK